MKLALVASDGKPADPLVIEGVEAEELAGSVRHGRIQNVDEVSAALQRTIEAMEARPGFAPAHIVGLYIGVGGRSLATVNATVRITIPDETPIDRKLIERLEDEAAQQAPEGRTVLSVIPLRYTVDDLVTVNPIGVIGSRLSAEYTVVHCDPRNLRNIETVVNKRLGLDICGWIVRPLALAELCITPEESKPGCLLADIGAETTTVSIFKDCNLRYIATIPLGSRHITNDLSMGLGITESEAENIKRRLGNAVADSAATSVDQIRIDKYVQARAQEIAANIVAYIEFAGFKNTDLGGGIIITGRGSKLKNFGRLLESQSRMKVRKATPRIKLDITDTSVVESDMLDLIAVAAKGVELAASPDASTSIEGPDPETEPEPALPSPKEKEKVFVIDDPHSTEHVTEPDAETEKTDEFGFAIGDDNSDKGFNTYDPDDPDEYSGHTTDESDDDPYLLVDDETAEKLKSRDEARKEKERRKALREQENQKEKERREALRRQKAEEKKKHPSPWTVTLNALKSKITDIISEPDPDNDSDDLYSISDEEE